RRRSPAAPTPCGSPADQTARTPARREATRGRDSRSAGSRCDRAFDDRLAGLGQLEVAVVRAGATELPVDLSADGAADEAGAVPRDELQLAMVVRTLQPNQLRLPIAVVRDRDVTLGSDHEPVGRVLVVEPRALVLAETVKQRRRTLRRGNGIRC